jgi:hypothetical protein
MIETVTMTLADQAAMSGQDGQASDKRVSQPTLWWRDVSGRHVDGQSGCLGSIGQPFVVRDE